MNNLINKAVELALTYKPYKLGGRNLACSADKNVVLRTAVPDYKLKDLAELVLTKQHLTGDILEVGVWRGGVGLLLATLEQTKPIYLVDTFDGLPSIDENDTYHKLHDFDDCSFEEVTGIFNELKLNNVTVLKGWFPKDFEKSFANIEFSLVHLDVDVYDSYIQSLEYIYPKLVHNGIIVLDDYAEASCNGATVAVNEFIEKYKLHLHTYGTLYYIGKY